MYASRDGMEAVRYNAIYLSPSRDGSFVLSSSEVDGSFTDATFYIFLPDGWYFCDFSWFTIWCELFWQFFTEIKIPESLFVSHQRISPDII